MRGFCNADASSSSSSSSLGLRNPRGCVPLIIYHPTGAFTSLSSPRSNFFSLFRPLSRFPIVYEIGKKGKTPTKETMGSASFPGILLANAVSAERKATRPKFKIATTSTTSTTTTTEENQRNENEDAEVRLMINASIREMMQQAFAYEPRIGCFSTLLLDRFRLEIN